MRVLVVALALLFAATVTVDARPRRPAKAKKARRVAVDTRSKHGRELEDDAEQPRPRTARIDDIGGQSIGAPWSGRLRHATRLRFGDGAYIRRPQRAFGTRTTVDHVRRAVNDTLELFPRAHPLAIGDLSNRDGGWISEHHSHQSGRDVDLGLFYKRKPPGYPASFVRATDDNLDPAATWALISRLLSTSDEDGGVQAIFLDFDVQGMIYNWAVEHGVATRRLDRVFQYPHGLGASAGIVRHEPNHDNHLHVRFRCATGDDDCR